MLKKIRQYFNRKTGSGKITGSEKNMEVAVYLPKKLSDDQTVAKQIHMSRRGFMQAAVAVVAAASAPKILAGCEEYYEFHPDDFYQNFPASNYERLDKDKLKEWDETVKYRVEDITRALNQSIGEDMAVRFDVTRLFDFHFQDDKIHILLKSEDTTELNNMLAGTGIHVVDLQVVGSTIELELADQDGNISEFKHLGYYLSIEGTAADGSDGIIFLPEKNDGKGIICMSGNLEPQPNDSKSFYYQANKARCLSPSGELLVADWKDNTGFYKASDQAEGFPVADKDSLMRFLAEGLCGVNCRVFFDRNSCTNTGPVGFIDTHGFDMSKLTDLKDLKEIIKNLPRSPEIFAGFVDSCIEYNKVEKSQTDNFKSPLESFRSKQADCDDFAVLNYYWAYLQNFTPYLTVLLVDEKLAHTFIWYRDEQNNLVVMDNVRVTILPPESEIKDYVNDHWPGMKIILNQPMVP